MAKAKPTHFVVERFNWRRSGNTPTFHRLPGFTRIRSFDMLEEAEGFKHAEEAKARAVVNPFLGTLAPPTDQTDLPDHALCDWYMDHDFEPPKPDKKTGKRDWAKWWEKESKKWKGDRAAVAWEPLHRVQFYRITERPKVPVGYALVRVNWEYNDEWHVGDEEGGTITAVYRNRERANKECATQNRTSVLGWGEDDAMFQLNDRTLPGRTPFDPPPEPVTPDEYGDVLFTAPEVPFCEVIEVELEGLA